MKNKLTIKEKDDIINTLLELGFNVSSRGFSYWIDAIEYIKAYPLKDDMMYIYEYIAKKHNSTVSRVERCLRFALEPAENNIQTTFRYYVKIKNNTFINLIRYKVISWRK